MAQSNEFSVRVNLLARPDEEPVLCFRSLVAPEIPTGLWMRRFLENNGGQYLLRIIQRIPEIKDRRCDSCLVQCGGGYDLLVLLHHQAPVPPDVSAIPKISVTLTLATDGTTDGAEDPGSQFGVIVPSDVLWMHMFVAAKAGALFGDFRIFLQTNMDGAIYHDDVESKQVVRLRMAQGTWKVYGVVVEETPPEVFAFRSPTAATSMVETDAGTLSDSTHELSRTQKKKTKVSSKMQATEKMTKHHFGFSPRESLILEKALKEELTGLNLEANCSHYSNDEFKSAPHPLMLMDVDSASLGTMSDAGKSWMTSDSNSAAGSGKSSTAKTAKTPHDSMAATIAKTGKSLISKKRKDANELGITLNSKARVADVRRSSSVSTKETASSSDILLTASTTKAPHDVRKSLTTKQARTPNTRSSASTAKQATTSNTRKQAPTPKTGASATSKKEYNDVDRKNCFYFPFCVFDADVCGGKQRGRCREVNSGRVTVPTLDKKEFLAVKRAAKRKLLVAEGKPCFYFPFCNLSVENCGGGQRGRCREVNNGNIKIPSNAEFFAAKKMAMKSVGYSLK